MRRLAGILKNSLTALSLLLCVAVCVLWVRSYGEAGGELLSWQLGDLSELRVVSRQLYSSWGRIRVYLWDSQYREEADYESAAEMHDMGFAYEGDWPDYFNSPSAGPPPPEWLGFSARSEGSDNWFFGERTRHLFVQAPHWFLAALLAVPPGVWLASLYSRRRARKRSRLGLCPACGYDLTGNISGVCPECGKVVGLTATPPRPVR